MLDRNDIPYVHWQMARSADGRSLLGQIASELDDLDQEIRQCILTPKRSVAGNPAKGCDILPFLDRPMSQRTLFVVSEIRRALDLYVPRIEVGRILLDFSFAHLKIRVMWRPKAWVFDEFLETEVDYVV